MDTCRSLAYSGVTLSAVCIAMLLRPATIQTSYARPAAAVTVDLMGSLRDFRRDHPDFDVVPTGGLGQYAGMVDPWLADVPTRTAAGQKVDTQTTDILGQNIAPHLESARPPLGGDDPLGIRVTGEIVVEDEGLIDAYNSTRGPYGEAGNYGRTAFISTNSEVAGGFEVKKKAVVKADVKVGPFGDPKEVITGKGAVVGRKENLDDYYDIPVTPLPPADETDSFVSRLDVVGTMTLVGDINPDDDKEPDALHFGAIELHEDSRLDVLGDLVIVCDSSFKMDEATLFLAPEASLTLFVGGDVEIKDDSTFEIADNVSGAVTVITSGDHELRVEKNSHVVATIIAADRELEIKESNVYGAYLGRDLKVGKKAGLHADDGNADMGAFNFAVTVREKLEIKESTFDAFDSSKGNYGATNSGLAALLMSNAIKDNKVKFKDSVISSDVLVGLGADPDEVIDLDDATLSGQTGAMPTPATIPVVLPPLLGMSSGDYKQKNVTLNWSGARRYEDVELENCIVRISGDAVVRADGKFKLKNSHIQLLPGATLMMYVSKELKLENNSTINAWGNPQRVQIRRTSVKKGKVKLENNTILAAWVQGAKTKMELKNNSVFLGSFAGDEFKAEKATVIVDMAGLVPCIPVDDTPGSLGTTSSGGIATSDTFRQWFTDDPWVNVSRPHVITLTRDGAGVYEYIEPEFYPADGALFGNEGDAHNYFFTYDIDAHFDYVDCGGGFIEFRGGDSCWIYIDGQLVIDLGGVDTTANQRIDVDRLGLSEGTHRLQLFYAQRKVGDTPFELRTNLLLDSQDFIPVSMQFD